MFEAQRSRQFKQNNTYPVKEAKHQLGKTYLHVRKLYKQWIPTKLWIKKYILKRWVFRVTLKVWTSEILRISWGSPFQREDPAYAKERSPHKLCVLGTTSKHELEDRRFLEGRYWMKRLVLYSGAEPCRQWQTSKSNLNTILEGIGGQWRDCHTGVMWLRRLDKVTIRTAVFCSLCNLASWVLVNW